MRTHIINQKSGNQTWMESNSLLLILKAVAGWRGHLINMVFGALIDMNGEKAPSQDGFHIRFSEKVHIPLQTNYHPLVNVLPKLPIVNVAPKLPKNVHVSSLTKIPFIKLKLFKKKLKTHKKIKK